MSVRVDWGHGIGLWSELLCDRNLWIDKITFVSGTTGPSPTGACSNPPPSATRPFLDDFNGPAGTPPDPQTWRYQLAASGLKVYTNSPRNASLDGNGNLAIVARKEPLRVPGAGTFPYTSARLYTEGLLEPCYGTLAARIKFPKGQGLWPVFFVLGADCATQGWPQCGEVDIMEQQGTVAGSTLHGDGYHLPVRAPFDISNDFHEFWMDWERDKIVVGVDNVTVSTWTAAALPAGTTWLFNDHPMMVILMLGVGGSGGEPNASTQFPATMLVDWVRYTPPYVMGKASIGITTVVSATATPVRSGVGRVAKLAISLRFAENLSRALFVRVNLGLFAYTISFRSCAMRQLIAVSETLAKRLRPVVDLTANSWLGT